MPFRQEKAQTFVEFALVFPLLLLIVYGIIEFGRFLFIYTAVTSSSREGARYGSASGEAIPGTYLPHYADCVGINDAIERVSFLTGFDPNNPVASRGEVLQIKYDAGPGTSDKYTACPPPVNDIYLGDRIKVKVSVCFEPIIPSLFPFFGPNGCGAGIRGTIIDSEARRMILKDMEIEGTPPPPIPTNTLVPSNTPTPPTPTNTLVPSNTPTPSHTPTFTPTGSPSATPTDTPTHTPTPTYTLTPTPTPFCEINSVDMYFSGKSFSWIVQSIGPGTVRLIDSTVDWPVGRGAILGQIDFGPPVWSGSAATSPFTVCQSCWTGLPSYRDINQYETKALTFHLSEPLYSGTYSVNATFLKSGFGTCSASISRNYVAPTPTP